MDNLFQAAGLEAGAPRPLAERLRPRHITDVVGQDHLLSDEGPLGRMRAKGRLASMILWGPPGVGKTTVARLLADDADLEFVQLSAVFSLSASPCHQRVSPEGLHRTNQDPLGLSPLSGHHVEVPM